MEGWGLSSCQAKHRKRTQKCIFLSIFMDQIIKSVGPPFTPPSSCESNCKYDLTQKKVKTKIVVTNKICIAQ